MRRAPACVLTLLLSAGLAGAGAPKITAARVGLPGGPNVSRSRNGAWAPVYVTLKADADGNPQGAFTLAVESADAEEVPYRTTRAVPALAGSEQRVVLAYARPGSDGSEFTVRLLGGDGKAVQTIPRVRRDSSNVGHEVVEAADVLFVTLGARLPGLRRAVVPADNQNADNPNADENAGVPGFAAVEDVALLPDRWFGYDAADVVVLATGSEAFVGGLLKDDAAARRDALLEWVRRGGRLVVSVGRNHQLVTRLLEKVPLADCGVRGSVVRSSLPRTADFAGREAIQQQRPLQKVEIACLTPGTSADVLVTEEPDASDLQKRPVLVQSACGMGRVILVAFDVDTPPFSTWTSQAAFWKKLQAEVAPRPAGQGNAELGNELQRALESFGEVPTISFGWVALFLLAYIALVGPVDYFLLKKVFKRLEWTWVTFPAIVLGVSVVAYLVAYHVKGDDLWVNKVDLVDVDLHGRQVVGNTWWSLFNPRSQAFTAGLEPAAPGWFTPPSGAEPAAATVGTLEGPLRTVPGSPGLFRKPYEYAEDAAGVRNVPVPVWATRSFAASWRVPFADAEPPVEAELRLSRDGTALAGTLVNRLPAELQGAALFFRGQWYPVGTLLSGERLEVQSLFERGVARRPLAEWHDDNSLAPRPPAGAVNHPSRPAVEAAQRSHYALKQLLFYALVNRKEGNSGQRHLDQSWRLAPLNTVPTTPQLQYRDEAVLVARTPSAADRAEAVTAGSDSPTRLWLGALPGQQSQRPPLPGYLAQETYVRVFIPVRIPR
jgi:hypothetical protein